jgi:hypothetical protein
MAISLTNAQGDPVSLFGSGNSTFATGDRVNPSSTTAMPTFGDIAGDRPPGLFSNFRTFGDTAASGASQTTAAPTTKTRAGSTQLGYTNLATSQRGARGRGGAVTGKTGGAVAPTKLVPDQEIGNSKGKPIEPPQRPDEPSQRQLDQLEGEKIKAGEADWQRLGRSQGRNDFDIGRNEAKPGMMGSAAKAAEDLSEELL